MFIKNIKLQNFKWFEDVTEISFNNPLEDWNGLNFFIGENNSWKSTIFEAINFLFSWSSDIEKLKNKNNISGEMFVEIDILWSDLKGILWSKYEKYIFSKNDFEFIKLRRSSSSTTIQQWSKSVEINSKVLWIWNDETGQFENPSWFSTAFKWFFDIDFIWADTNPDDITKFWTSTIVWKLLSKISEWFTETEEYKNFQNIYNKVFNDNENSLKSKMNDVERELERVFGDQFWNAKINFHFDSIDISSYFKNTKLKVDDWVDTFLDEKWNWMQRSIALALLQVYVEKFLKNAWENEKPFYFFIDEPEICLHPQAQIKLIKSLSKLSKTQQIFLTTHSPYIFKTEGVKLSNVKIFKKENLKNKVINETNFWLFEWSPSWWEINYFAYNLPTIEFYNELYWYLEEKNKNWKNSLPATKQYIDSRKVDKRKQDLWRELNEGELNGLKVDVCLLKYIRDMIHHPENTYNDPYSEKEIETSINEMIELVKSINLSSN